MARDSLRHSNELAAQMSARAMPYIAQQGAALGTFAQSAMQGASLAHGMGMDRQRMGLAREQFEHGRQMDERQFGLQVQQAEFQMAREQAAFEEYQKRSALMQQEFALRQQQAQTEALETATRLQVAQAEQQLRQQAQGMQTFQASMALEPYELPDGRVVIPRGIERGRWQFEARDADDPEVQYRQKFSQRAEEQRDTELWKDRALAMRYMGEAQRANRGPSGPYSTADVGMLRQAGAMAERELDILKSRLREIDEEEDPEGYAQAQRDLRRAQDAVLDLSRRMRGGAFGGGGPQQDTGIDLRGSTTSEQFNKLGEVFGGDESAMQQAVSEILRSYPQMSPEQAIEWVLWSSRHQEKFGEAVKGWMEGQ